MPEWSKGVDSSSTSASCVGSNPTAVTCDVVRHTACICQIAAFSLVDITQECERMSMAWPQRLLRTQRHPQAATLGSDQPSANLPHLRAGHLAARRLFICDPYNGSRRRACCAVPACCCQRGYGATAARLTPDQKVGSSNLSALIFAICSQKYPLSHCRPSRDP